MNVWNFVGYLGKDAETRYLQSGDPVVSFSVGVKSGYGDKATTTWARCSMFGTRGEAVAPYLMKGQQVAISGEPSLREYTDKQGQTRSSLEVRVNDLTLVGKRDAQPAAQQAPRQQAPAPQQAGGFGDMDDDIPFMRHAHGAAWRAI